jgi:hypothetical protein
MPAVLEPLNPDDPSPLMLLAELVAELREQVAEMRRDIETLKANQNL